MPADAVTWVALASAVGLLITLLTFWTRYSDRITATQKRAEQAEKAADEAKQEAKVATAKAGLLSDKIYQTEIWARDEFVRKASFELAVGRMERGFDTMKSEIASRLDRMTERIEHINDKRQPVGTD